MNKILFSIFFVLISNALCAQDLIVTNYYPNVRIAAVGGYSLRTRLPKSSWDDSYYKDMKNGWHYGIELNYFFTESLGIGMNFYSSHFKAEDRNGINKVRIQHFIPTFNARDFDKQKI